MMQLLFFDRADKILFVRDDMQSGSWTQEEMSLTAVFPYKADKEITQGIRVGFRDDLGDFQVFEIRKVRNYEPDHYQEITAENIVISELSDDFYKGGDVDDQTPESALTTLLTGTLWSVGNVTATNISTATLNMGDVYQNIQVIMQNWNVLITPRATVGPNGITGRYLDIAPHEGVWRGLRLSLEKNAEELGVTIDDSDVFTAMYGFGHSLDVSTPSEDRPALTFEDVEWQATADHPAKPLGQKYIEDPAATALYGRNGRARFTFYQNADITDPEILLEKTWESLKQSSEPKITIDCMVRDLYRMGYQDQPLRVNDKVIVELRELGKTYTLDIIRVTVNLLDPTATQVTIGAYIPNIIYIQRETEQKAGGGGGGGRGKGQTNAEVKREEFETEIAWNKYQITLKASQNDLTTLEGVVRQSEIKVDAQGVTITSILNNVGDGTQVTAATIATAINNGTSSVLIQADRIDIDGLVTALQAKDVNVDGLQAGRIDATSLYVDNHASFGSLSVADVPFSDCFTDVEKTQSGGTVTLTFTNAGGGTSSVSFDSAQAVTLAGPTWASGGVSSAATFTVTASNGASKSQMCTISAGSWSSGSRRIYLSAGGAYVANLDISLPASGTWSSNRTSQSNLRVFFTLAGKTYQSDFGV